MTEPIPTVTLAATPPMGWNSWNMFGDRVTEADVRETADTLARLGLRELGYEYVVIDDCWSVKDGRDPDGNLVPNPLKFPAGIAALAEHVHSLGLKLGIYSDAADRTCAGYAGSHEFEEQDAALWASWGVDFLKYDYCNAPTDQPTAMDRYARMGRALRGTGREILYSMCEWGGRHPHLWGADVGAQMWRVTGDVFDSWVNVWMPTWGTYGIGVDVSLDAAATLAPYGGPGRWNDLDMLVVGLRGKGQIHGTGMSQVEYQTHMSLWVMACSPLMIGCDLRAMDRDTAALLMNPEVLAVNQDVLGIPARRVRVQGRCETWAKPLADGSVAVALINRDSTGQDMQLRAGDIGLLDTRKLVRDLWAQQDTADFGWGMALRVEPHETRLLRVTP
ncbi:glycoside hydrolase family 27 protein [Deinococcus sp. A31D244]|uniref:glycoside hydrolase family 27 protein n=1 Tax=Deinococcus sp. A31D244 TaxID=3397675 RepID=UPI0039DF7E02